MKVVLVMFKDTQRREFPLNGEKTILGRRDDCDLRIPAKDVSRQHCELLVADDKLVAKDLGSSNGTFVNGKRIAQTELKPGDRLRIGPVTFVVQIDGQPAEISPADTTPTSKAAPTPAGADEETFDLSDIELELEDSMLEDEEEEEEKLP